MDCKDHSEYEAPWMCACTSAQLSHLLAENAALKRRVAELEARLHGDVEHIKLVVDGNTGAA